MSGAIEELASAGVHDKVFDIVTGLPGANVFDAPAGYGALIEKLLASGKSVTAADIDIEKFQADRSNPNLRLSILQVNANKYSSRNLVSVLLRLLYKLIYAHKDSRDCKRSRGNYGELYRLILSDEIYYGETLIKVAQKTAAAQ